MNKSKPSTKSSPAPFSDLTPRKKDALGLAPEQDLRKRSRRWLLVSVATFAFAVGVVALSVGPILSAAHSQAVKLGSQADGLQKTDPDKALLDYRMAHMLDPGNATYILHMADLYLARQQPDDAIKALMQLTPEQAGERVADIQFKSGKFEDAIATAQVLINLGHSQAYLVQARSYLELNQLDNAQAAAKKAQADSTSREEGVVLETAATKLAGRDSSISEGAVSSPERLSQLQNIKAGELPLAQSLYSLGLLNSSQRVLMSLAANNTQVLVLLADIKLAEQPTSQGHLLAAVDYLRQAIAVNPSDVELHKQLKAVYSQLGNSDGVKAEDGLINRLQTGNI
jgi:tetratricopeptide (TPR) repeat protein